MYLMTILPRSLCVILSIDLLITMALRFFKSQQCAVILQSITYYVHDFQTCFHLNLKLK